MKLWATASALLFLSTITAGVAATGASETTVVMTEAGAIRGIADGDVLHFRGVPYAAPPVGEKRWRPTGPVVHWNGVRPADHFAPHCVQNLRGVFPTPSKAEDCLYLNIDAPNTKTTMRPVMVWIHGGGLNSGESEDYDGSLLAREGDAVVVTINYRLGILGFFAHPALDREGHPFANYGFMDQQFALAWLKRNVSRFGGDPNNITIFGQSGGASAVIATLASPTAKGLFEKAIIESGTHFDAASLGDAEKTAARYAEKAGCTGTNAASCLRALSIDQILPLQTEFQKEFSAAYFVVDGTILKRTPEEAFTTGDFTRVPLLAGLNSDEQGFSLSEVRDRVVLTDDGLQYYIAAFGAQHVADIDRTYPRSAFPSASVAEIAVAQGMKACTVRHLYQLWSKYTPLFVYSFEDKTAPSYLPAVSYPTGAYHTAELQYLFPLFHGGQGTPHPLNAKQTELARVLVKYWTNFARSGDPNQAGLPVWQRYADATDNVQTLDIDNIHGSSGYGKASYPGGMRNACDLWDGINEFH